MTQEQVFLLNLIRAGVDGYTDFPVPDAVDWDALIDEAKRQNVPVLASDGLQKLYDAGLYNGKQAGEILLAALCRFDGYRADLSLRPLPDRCAGRLVCGAGVGSVLCDGCAMAAAERRCGAADGGGG